MSKDIIEALRQIEKEKGIAFEALVVHFECLDVDVLGEDELVDAHVAGLGVDLDLGVLHGVGRLLVGGEQRVFERLDERFEGDALLLLDLS